MFKKNPKQTKQTKEVAIDRDEDRFTPEMQEALDKMEVQE